MLAVELFQQHQLLKLNEEQIFRSNPQGKSNIL
jgi:hypothetical protein